MIKNITRVVSGLVSKKCSSVALITSSFVSGVPSTKRENSTSSVKLNFYENNNQYHLEAEVPGCVIDDLRLRVNEGQLTIEVLRSKQDVENVGSRNFIYHIVEREVLSTKRVFRLPADAKIGLMTAKLAHGVLYINMPRLAHLENDDVDIPIDT
jgi:HSP20 family molecular chaperone IbpA